MLQGPLMNRKIIFSLITLLLIVLSGIFLKKKIELSNREAAHSTKVYTKLNVGTSSDFPPFSFRDKTDEIIGFDIDVIKEIVKRLNLKMELIDRPFSMLIPQIQIGQIDVIAAGMTPSPEREKNLRFTKPYLNENPLVIVTLKDKTPKIKNIEDLKGKSVIVNTGYVSDMYVSKFPEIQLIRLPKVTDAMIALEHNKADAFVTANLTLKPYNIELGTKDNTKFNVTLIEDTTETSALGVSKKISDELFEKIQAALDEMEKDGTLKAIKLKWKME